MSKIIATKTDKEEYEYIAKYDALYVEKIKTKDEKNGYTKGFW